MAYYLIGISTGMLLGYGWMLDASTVSKPTFDMDIQDKSSLTLFNSAAC